MATVAGSGEYGPYFQGCTEVESVGGSLPTSGRTSRSGSFGNNNPMAQAFYGEDAFKELSRRALEEELTKGSFRLPSGPSRTINPNGIAAPKNSQDDLVALKIAELAKTSMMGSQRKPRSYSDGRDPRCN